MIYAALYPLACVLALFTLWLLFVVAMALQAARDAGRLTPGMVKFGTALVMAAELYDVLCNILFASGVLFEPPREATVSARLRRLVHGDPAARRTRLAIWFAAVLMNPFCPPDKPHIPLPIVNVG